MTETVYEYQISCKVRTLADQHRPAKSKKLEDELL